MSLRTFVAIVWGVFWVYWLLAALGAKTGGRGRRRWPCIVLVLAAVLLLRVFRIDGLAVRSLALEATGLVLVMAGLGTAVWARIHLGRNWGMPMTEKDEPELVTSGPYRFVRHPIYSGLLLAFLGTALATNLAGLTLFAVAAGYFIHSARVEEGLLTSSFPAAYPSYRARTKLLIPFVL